MPRQIQLRRVNGQHPMMCFNSAQVMTEMTNQIPKPRAPVTGLDEWLSTADQALKTLAGAVTSSRPRPGKSEPEAVLSGPEKLVSGALMRVNHVGEVCAQALYLAQSLSTHDPRRKTQFLNAAKEEADHLAWTADRLRELGARPSLLNPLWFAGAFTIGFSAGRLGDRISLGFMQETEKQVEQHLASHLTRLPASDAASRAIVDAMKADEAEHARQAELAGAKELPGPVKSAMRWAAKVMTTTANRI